ncbi:hypothetical protein [Streptomyces antimicrobicus]|uniref:Ferredoxin n=1 Tax=Streptomyces antimicrobicus TaxID=2883108 RepID=A0ABS8BB06_9ACTN|nr:hypothetical protein [Streptomyces antimicrobicus]MCB5181804.1 hypothetical protein [Streptomyces antimicrobicus]
MNSSSALPSCPLCRTRAQRVSWRSAPGEGPVEVVLQPCGHVLTCARAPEIVCEAVPSGVPERAAGPA